MIRLKNMGLYPNSFNNHLIVTKLIIRKYLPILKNMPVHYIHEPWLAPENVQRAAKCVIGKDYPLPMVNHTTASRNNIQRMKQVYEQLANYKLMENARYDGMLREDFRVSLVSIGNPTVITINNQSI